MPRARQTSSTGAIEAEDLVGLGKAKLADLLAEQLAGLPYHRRKEWARRHLPAEVRSTARPRPDGLLLEIEAFCGESRSGTFVSWENDREWFDGDDRDADDERFEEWVQLFTDLTKGALGLTRSGRHADAAEAYRMLLGLLEEARTTTDILGNHGAPEDSVEVDFAEVVAGYTKSLRACRPSVDEAITAVLPVAKRFRYAGGFAGLVRGLERAELDRLEARLSAAAEAALQADRRDCPDEVEGLIALAHVRKRPAEVLALKERFASRNAVYLKEVLSHYVRRRDWAKVARLAESGVEHFGRHDEFSKALIRAREALGDRPAAQEAEIVQFLGGPLAARFAALRKRAAALSNWEAVFERVLKASTSPRRSLGYAGGLRTRLLLAEGREAEAIDGVMARGHPDIEESKLVAKYAVARVSEKADLSQFKKLTELQRRLAREKEDPYDWLRLLVGRPATLTRDEYVRLAADMYRRLVDLHLDSGKPSRAAPAAHYCAVVVEISRLVGNAALWADLLRHLRTRHGKKRLIWDRLRTEGCPLE